MRAIKVIAIALLVLVGTACHHRAAAPQGVPTVVILLPNEDGKPGSLVVSNIAGTQQVAEPYSRVRLSRAETAPSAPAPVDPKEVERLFGETLAMIPPPEVRFNLYFESGGTVLTAESAAELPKIIEAYHARQSTDVTIIGHTDTVGDRQANYELGMRRAEQIGQEMQARGVDKAHMFIESHGENDLLAPTADNVEDPRNRRVEIIVR